MEHPADLTQRIESTEAELDSAWLNGPPTAKPVELVEYDQDWPKAFETLRSAIAAALPGKTISVEHIGSTSVPGLLAKPIIDIDLVVQDSRQETEYVPALEALGFSLEVREPNWHEHRMLRLAQPRVNLHVFSPDCPETVRHLVFRDWLRAHPEDAERYADCKREARNAFPDDVRGYTSAKDAVIDRIYAKAFGAA
ncbi:MAG: GrpB family protein [Renibacterium sp.]|nr:GrpB family protein [Renibacterium sp.]